MTENIRRGLVVGAIERHIRENVASLGLIEDKAQKEPHREQERWRIAREKVEERIVTLMQLAGELELYEEATADIDIPQYLVEEYRAAYP